MVGKSKGTFGELDVNIKGEQAGSVEHSSMFAAWVRCAFWLDNEVTIEHSMSGAVLSALLSALPALSTTTSLRFLQQPIHEREQS